MNKKNMVNIDDVCKLLQFQINDNATINTFVGELCKTEFIDRLKRAMQNEQRRNKERNHCVKILEWKLNYIVYEKYITAFKSFPI